MGRFIDLTGQRFGRLIVKSRAENSAQRLAMWHCECDCGVQTITHGKYMRNGNTTSCGCVFREKSSARLKTHGKSDTSEYYVYKSAKNRCRNPDDAAYGNYGGRGIKFNFANFEEFINHVGPRPSDEHSIDRIDTNGHYEIGNVRWATQYIQANNRRSNLFVTIDNTTMTLAQWLRARGIKNGTYKARVANGWSREMAIMTPLRGTPANLEAAE